MKLFLAEKLTFPVLAKYAHLINAAEMCWALRTQDGSVALHALANEKWQIGDAPLHEGIDGQLAAWANQLALKQVAGDCPLSSCEQALLAYGIWARLWPAFFATALVEHSISLRGRRLGDATLTVVANDPYLRNAFRSFTHRRPRPRILYLERAPGSFPIWQALRERVLATARLRRLLPVAPRMSRRVAMPTIIRAKGGRGVAAVFILNQRFLDICSPVISELESRGWEVYCVHYQALSKPVGTAIDFKSAVSGWNPSRADERAINPMWRMDPTLLAWSPVSCYWTKTSMSASWVTGLVQKERHRYLLERLRPDVAITFGPETMSLALQCAAESLEIPTLFLAHGFMGPMHAPPGFFSATASALFGEACVDANRKRHDGSYPRGLVATGYPPYDDILRRGSGKERRLEIRSGLRLPPEQPYCVLCFATWATYPLWGKLQRKTLRMLAEALPEDCVLVCKLHPSCEERTMCESVLGDILPPKAFRVVGEREYQTVDLLAACDVAVANEHSMALRDAVVMGRPGIAVRDAAFPRNATSCNPLNHPGSDFNGTCLLVESMAQLRHAILILTRDASARQECLKNRKSYIDAYLVASDAQSGRRVTDLIEHLAARKNTDSYIPSIGESLLE